MYAVSDVSIAAAIAAIVFAAVLVIFRVVSARRHRMQDRRRIQDDLRVRGA